MFDTIGEPQYGEGACLKGSGFSLIFQCSLSSLNDS